MRFLPFILCAATFPLPLLHGVVNFFDPQGNTTAPSGTNGEPSDPGFDHVGIVEGSSANGSGVYLGYGWVLTANHVNAGTFITGGQSYAYNGTDSHRIGETDLRLFKLATDPGLPAMAISEATPVLSTDVVMIGGGRTPESSSTVWWVDMSPETWVWSEDYFPEANAQIEGYKTSSTRTVRWGTNRIHDYGTLAGANTLVTHFSAGAGATAYEAQAVRNDSGGGVFVDTLDGWHLAGIMAAVQTFSGQPDGNRTAVFGNVTHAIDLSHYREDILAIIPEASTLLMLLLIGGLAPILAIRHRKRA